MTTFRLSRQAFSSTVFKKSPYIYTNNYTSIILTNYPPGCIKGCAKLCSHPNRAKLTQTQPNPAKLTQINGTPTQINRIKVVVAFLNVAFECISNKIPLTASTFLFFEPEISSKRTRSGVQFFIVI